MRAKKININIVGAGEIGVALAGQLTADGCSVTVIDTDAAVLSGVGNTLDVFCYQGNGASHAALQEAGAGDADVLIAVTESDELNILACMTAHLLGAKHTIARVRNIDYARETDFYRERLGLSMTINPELAVAREISRLLRFPSATRVEVFAEGRAELVEMRLQPDSPFCDKSLMDIVRRTDFDLLICAVVRGNEIHIPKGNFVLQANDILYLTGAAAAFRKSFKAMEIPLRPLHNALLTGTGRIAYYLAELLAHEGVRPTIIERSHEKAAAFGHSLPKCAVMNDDTIGYFNALSAADLRKVDAYISLTDSDEYNMLAGMYADSLGIGRVICRVSSYSRLKALDQGRRLSTVSREDTAVDLIVGYARSLMNADGKDAVESLYRLMDGRLEFTQFHVTASSSHLGQPLKEWQLKPDMLVACILREGQPILPRGDDVIQPGDSVLMVSIGKQLVRLEDIFVGG